MSVEINTHRGSDWRVFFRKHWGAVIVFGVAIFLAFVGAAYVFWWFAGNAVSTNLVPSGLNLWTMNNVVTYIVYLILYELLIIGIPVLVGGVIAWQWWRRLPDEEHGRYRWGRRTRTTRGSGGVSLLFFIGFAIKIYLDGNWNVPVATWTLSYVVNSMITVAIWAAIIFGIPATIGVLWWVRREMKRP